MSSVVLIVDDEAPIRDMIRYFLEPQGFIVDEAEDAKQAYHQIADRLPSVILLDWMLPDISGIEVVKQLQQDPVTSDIPIIMLTARAEEDSKVKGLTTGADDYVVKPFSPKELLARIQAVLRRGVAAVKEGKIEIGDMKLDTSNQRLLIEQTVIPIGPMEFRVLQFLVTHPDRIYSRTQLLDAVWGGQADITERAVDVVIRRVRRALEGSPYVDMVQTVRGLGYRFSQQCNKE